ncbi:MAG: hypothetical protein EA401_06975 [Planctomycetota bacterium]|nr:MAG: hypothetical protein EA401_06975 [Planctomycetota bacterium]
MPGFPRFLTVCTLAAVCSSVPLLADEDWHEAARALPGIGEDLRWGGSDGTTVVAFSDGYVVVESAVGHLRIDPAVLERDPDQTWATAAALSQRAAAALGEDAPTLTLRQSPLLDLHLQAENLLVTADDVLHRQDVSTETHDTQIAQVSTAAQGMGIALAEAPIGRHARSVLVHLVDLLDQTDRDPVSDEINPAFARKVVRHGWLLDAVDGLEPPAQALTLAVQEATSLRPWKHFRGEAAEWTVYGDAWETHITLYRSEDSLRAELPKPIPMYYWPMQGDDGFTQARVIAHLPVSSDPINQPQSVSTAQRYDFYHANTHLAQWTAEDGFSYDYEQWRSTIPDQHRRLDRNIVDGYMPPHIVIMDGYGDIHGIINEHGRLLPPADGSRQEAERFIDDAAQLLPDAAQLDLISQYLFKYAYDSPDPTMPLLMGTREVKSDIHQTAWETLSTTIGGVCRGDCDDLSEVMEHIVERQGRLGHVISLPGHAALAWAEEDDEQWHVFVMQTGPTLQFSHPRLQEALRATYTSFDASDTFDPHGIGLLLRFSGENTRSPWRLSYRIFAEPEYAATMIDVQKDWHYQTYMQAINKMLAMVEAGDHDTSNYRELAGLYSFTGQYDKAIEYHQSAMERTDEAESHLLMAIELLIHLNDAERHDELEALAVDILDRQLPEARGELGESIIQIGLQLAGFLTRYDLPELAARALGETVADLGIDRAAENVAQWSQFNFDPEAWQLSGQLRMIDRILGWHSRVLARIFRHDRDGSIREAIPQLKGLIQADRLYRTYIAFNGQADGGDLASTYALIGMHLEAEMGRQELLAALAEAPMPEAPIDHRNRDHLNADDLRARDLQWVKASVAFWNTIILESLDDIRERALSPEQAAEIAPQLTAAIAAAEDLGLSGPRTDYMAHYSQLIIALITEDEEALEGLLQHVRAQNDKRLTDNTAQYMGDVAYALNREWFTRSVEMWRDIVDHKPKYLWIAWRAALNHAPEKALIAARIAAERFPDSQAFVDEYAFMQELLGDQ